MKRIKKILSSILVVSMLLPNTVFAEGLINAESIGDKISSAIEYGIDKAMNTVINTFSTQDTKEADNNDEEEKEFKDPGMDLDNKAIHNLYNMGYSMIDISNAIKLSKICEETPYSILLKKGLRTNNNIQAIDLSDEENASNGDKTWSTVKSELNIDEDIELEENSENTITSNTQDVEKIFEELSLDDLLLENGLQESDIAEAINNGIVENMKSSELDIDIDGEDVMSNEKDEAVFITSNNVNISGAEATIANDTGGDEITSYYNGYIYPMAKYSNEKTSGYTVEEGYDINPLSGNLTVVENDLSLKGINGLDLNLNRIYSSERANMLDAKAWIPDDQAPIQLTYYRVFATAEIYITYREASSNGGNTSVVERFQNVTLTPSWDDESGLPIYTAVDKKYVDKQIVGTCEMRTPD